MAAPALAVAQAGDVQLTPRWEYVADTVMGGVSRGSATAQQVAGRAAMRLTGDVSLDNNGGFVQIAFDLADGAAFDASGYEGIALEVYGNGAAYDLRLRTSALTRPWQSFRAEFVARPAWQRIEIPFAALQAHRTDAAFDPATLRRIGILAIGREMQADIAVGSVSLYAAR
ncbi:MAG: CIA30 family protein [Pseudomonadota bacterium]